MKILPYSYETMMTIRKEKRRVRVTRISSSKISIKILNPKTRQIPRQKPRQAQTNENGEET